MSAGCWNALHVLEATTDEVIVAVRAARARCLVFPAGRWTTVVQDTSPTELGGGWGPPDLDEPLLLLPGRSLSLFCDPGVAAGGWSFLIEHDGEPAAEYTGEWHGGAGRAHRSGTGAPALQRLLGVSSGEARELSALLRSRDPSVMQRAPEQFCELVGLGRTRELSLDLVHELGDEEITRRYGAFFRVDPSAAAAGDGATMPPQDSARRFLETLLEAGAVTLEQGASAERLVQSLAPLLEQSPPGAVLGAWLMEQDELCDLFWSDEELSALLEVW